MFQKTFLVYGDLQRQYRHKEQFLTHFLCLLDECVVGSTFCMTFQEIYVKFTQRHLLQVKLKLSWEEIHFLNYMCSNIDKTKMVCQIVVN